MLRVVQEEEEETQQLDNSPVSLLGSVGPNNEVGERVCSVVEVERFEFRTNKANLTHVLVSVLLNGQTGGSENHSRNSTKSHVQFAASPQFSFLHHFLALPQFNFASPCFLASVQFRITLSPRLSLVSHHLVASPVLHYLVT